MLHRIAVLFVLLAACTAPDQHDAARYGITKVAYGAALDTAPPFRADQLAEMRAELVDLNALGPTFVEVSEGDADVVVRPFDSTIAAAGVPCGAGVERFHIGSAYVEIDVSCAHGYDELRTAEGHGLGHFKGLRHICQHYEADTSCDLSVGTGDAMMNPSIAYDADADPSSGVTASTPVPTLLDLAEFRAVHP